MSKRFKQQRTSFIRRLKSTPTLLVVGCVLAAAIIVPLVHADQFDAQIQELQNQNSQSQQVVNQLQAQANSYQGAINQLQAQISAIQALINANQAKQAQLQQQIDTAQAELDHDKQVLGEDIRAMYIDGQTSTIEMLASSKNLSEFVDRQEYRSAVQTKLQTTLVQITQLQNELKDQKTQVDQLLVDQHSQQAQLDAAEGQQAQLLSYNQGQQSAYNQQIESNHARIADLRRQQAILNGRYNIGNMKGDPNNGGYPSIWARASQDSMIDDWGMYNRECVSYTAFRAHQDYMAGKNSRDMPYWGGQGNANQWDDDARASGIPVDGNPTPGSIAISNSGPYGHAMYVEQASVINGQQAVYVQQYNAGLDGQYSEGWRYTTGLVFIHF